MWLVGSPTSASNLMGGEHQRGNNSGSSEDQSDDEIEAGSCDQSTDALALKRMRRSPLFLFLPSFITVYIQLSSLLFYLISLSLFPFHFQNDL